MPNENLFYFVRFSIFHQKSTFNFSWNYVRFRRFFEFFQFNFPRNYVRFCRFPRKKFFYLLYLFLLTVCLTSIFYTSGMHNLHLYNIRPHPAAVHESSVRLLRRFPHVLRNIQHHPAAGLTLPVRHFPDYMSHV